MSFRHIVATLLPVACSATALARPSLVVSNLVTTVTPLHVESLAFAVGAPKPLLVVGGDRELDDGIYPVIESEAMLPDGSADSFELDATSVVGEGRRAELRDIGRKLCLYVGAAAETHKPVKWIWTGGGASTDGEYPFFDGANWVDGEGVAPSLGNPIMSGDSFLFLTGGMAVRFSPPSPDFEIGSMEFRHSEGDIVLTGGKISKIGLMACTGGANVEFLNEVEFGDAIEVFAASGHVRFTGGVAGAAPLHHTTFYGNYVVTNDEWTVAVDLSISEDSSIRAKNVNVATGHLVNIGENSVWRCESFTALQSGLGRNFGKFVVDGLWKVYPPNGTKGYIGSTSGSGDIVIGGLEVKDATGTDHDHFRGTSRYIIGSGGFSWKCGSPQWSVSELYFGSQANWTYNAPSFGGNSTAIEAAITFDTGDYYDAAVPRTITIKGNIAAKSSVACTQTITGCGTAHYVFDGGNATGLVAAKGNATLAVNAWCRPGGGAVTMYDRSTLRLVEAGAGTVTLGGTLTMGSETALEIDGLSQCEIPLKVAALVVEEGESRPRIVLAGEMLHDGVYPLVVSETPFGEDVAGMFAIDAGAVVPDGTRVGLEACGDTLLLEVGDNPLASSPVFIGGASGLFSDAENWLGGVVPGEGFDGTLFFKDLPSGTVDKGASDASPSQIVFLSCGNLRIEGDFAGLRKIVCRDSATHVFAGRVDFAGAIDVVQTARLDESADPPSVSGGSIVFEGGVHGTNISNHNIISGVYHLTDRFTATAGGANRMVVTGGSSVTAPELGDTTELYIMAGGAVTGAVKTVSGRKDERLFCWNGGEYVVAGKLLYGQSGGEIRAGYRNKEVFGAVKAGIVELAGANAASLSYAKAAGTIDWHVGSGGLSFGDGATGRYVLGYDGTIVRMHPIDGDLSIGSGTGGAGIDLSADYTTLVIDTKDAAGTPRTVAVDAEISGCGALVQATGGGKVVFNSPISFKCGLKADGGTTLTLAGNAVSGGCPIVVDAGSSLDVPRGGELGCRSLYLGNGAAVKLAFTRHADPKITLAPADVPMEAVVMTYNVRTGDGGGGWDHRKASLVRLIKKHRPDVCGFNEMKDYHRNYILANMEDFSIVTTPIKNAIGYRTDRWDLIENGSFNLPRYSGDSGETRCCNWVRLKDKATGAELVYASTHLDQKGPDTGRRSQFNGIPRSLAGFIEAGIPVVVGGDMNTYEPTEAMQYGGRIFNDSFLVSETSPKGPLRTFNGFSWVEPENEVLGSDAVEWPVEKRGNTTRHIDFIFCTRNLRVKEYEVDNEAQSEDYKSYPSDHFPVVCRVATPAGVSVIREGTVKISVSGCPAGVADARRIVLTSGAGLAKREDGFVLDNPPSWARRLAVEDGELVLYTRPMPFLIKLR